MEKKKQKLLTTVKLDAYRQLPCVKKHNPSHSFELMKCVFVVETSNTGGFAKSKLDLVQPFLQCNMMSSGKMLWCTIMVNYFNCAIFPDV